MKKIFVFSLVALALSTTAFADKDKKPTTKTKISCAVMKNDMVDIKKATADKMYADYKGKRYFFCCAGCPAAFEKDPAKYVKSDSIPTPKAAKKIKKG